MAEGYAVVTGMTRRGLLAAAVDAAGYELMSLVSAGQQQAEEHEPRLLGRGASADRETRWPA